MSAVGGDAHPLDIGEVVDGHPTDGRWGRVALEFHLVEVDEAAEGVELQLAEGVFVVVAHGVPPGVVTVRVP